MEETRRAAEDAAGRGRLPPQRHLPGGAPDRRERARGLGREHRLGARLLREVADDPLQDRARDEPPEGRLLERGHVLRLVVERGLDQHRRHLVLVARVDLAEVGRLDAAIGPARLPGRLEVRHELAVDRLRELVGAEREHLRGRLVGPVGRVRPVDVALGAARRAVPRVRVVREEDRGLARRVEPLREPGARRDVVGVVLPGARVVDALGRARELGVVAPRLVGARELRAPGAAIDHAEAAAEADRVDGDVAAGVLRLVADHDRAPLLVLAGEEEEAAEQQPGRALPPLVDEEARLAPRVAYADARVGGAARVHRVGEVDVVVAGLGDVQDEGRAGGLLRGGRDQPVAAEAERVDRAGQRQRRVAPARQRRVGEERGVAALEVATPGRILRAVARVEDDHRGLRIDLAHGHDQRPGREQHRDEELVDPVGVGEVLAEAERVRALRRPAVRAVVEPAVTGAQVDRAAGERALRRGPAPVAIEAQAAHDRQRLGRARFVGASRHARELLARELAARLAGIAIVGARGRGEELREECERGEEERGSHRGSSGSFLARSSPANDRPYCSR